METLTPLEAARRRKWDRRFLELAELVSGWSKDPRRQVGCVLVDADRNPITLGFNGFPRGVTDSQSRLEDRELKNKHIVHAEANAVFTAARAGRSLKGATAYITCPFCHICAQAFIQVGVIRVVYYGFRYEPSPEWIESYKLGQHLLGEAGVEIKLEGLGK